MLGFQPQNVTSTDPNWQVIDNFLKKYIVWMNFLNAFIYLKAKNNEFIIEWRKEAEQNMRAKGQTGMSDE